MKIKIESIGTPSTIQTKYGPKEKNWVKVEGDYAGKFLNYWVSESTKEWKVGMIVDVDTIEEREYKAKDGAFKISYDIKLPRISLGEIMGELEALRKRVYALEQKAILPSEQARIDSIPYPEEDLDPNDVPF